MMRQLQFYKYTTWGLFVLNLAMIAFFFLTKPKPRSHPPQEDGKNRVVDILKLDEQQHDAFSNYAEEHIRQMNGFDRQQRNLLKPYFNSLIEVKESVDSDSLLVQVTQLERKKIESTYQHFQDIKSILKPEQQPYFGAFIDHALGIILFQQNNPPPPKGN